MSNVDIDVSLSDPRSDSLEKSDYGKFSDKHDFAKEKIKEGSDSIPSTPIMLLKHGQNYTNAEDATKQYKRGPRINLPPPPQEIFEALNQEGLKGETTLSIGPELKNHFRSKFGIKPVD